MSWSIDVTGTKSDVSKKVTEQLDAIAAHYDGKEEGKDVLIVKERFLAIIEAVDLTKPEDMSPDSPSAWNAVVVRAAGSHSLTDQGIATAQMSFLIMRKHVG